VHRRHLLGLLDAYRGRYPEEQVRVDRVRRFVETHADCFERTCRDGHVTGSAWILSADECHVLLVHHRKLVRWLQPGGHADGEPDPIRVALREAGEECGLAELAVLSDEEPVASAESTALQWFERRRLTALIAEKSLLRMERKTRALLGRPS